MSRRLPHTLKATVRQSVYLILSVLLCARALSVGAQGRAIVRVYHGDDAKSAIVTLVENGTSYEKKETQLEFVRPAGSQVCIEVVNPHPLVYSYSLGTRIDTTKFDLAAVASLSEVLLQTIGDAGLSVGVSAAADITGIKSHSVQALKYVNTPDSTSWWLKYLGQMTKLHGEAKQAQDSAAASDIPRSYKEVADGDTEFLRAKTFITKTLSREAGHFNDPSLASTFERYFADAKAAAAQSADTATLGRHLLEALRVASDQIVKTVGSFRSTWERTGSAVQECLTLGTEPTTVKLRVTRRDSAKAGPRTTGEPVSVKITPSYVRPWLKVVPVAYTVFLRDVRRFDIVDGVVKQDTDDETFDYRVGGMLALKLKEIGDDKSAAISIGLGSNLLGGGKAFEELLIGGLATYRDLFTIGIGWGQVKVRDVLQSPATDGTALPSGKSLSDLLAERDKSGVFLLFNLTGLKLALPKAGSK